MSNAVMSRQLDILAIEPYHGGDRRAMLEVIARLLSELNEQSMIPST